MKNNKKDESGQKNSVSVLGLIALIYVVIGAMMLFINGGLGYVIHILEGALIVLGAWWVFRYLKSDGYMQPNNYDFSVGMLMIIFGVWLLVQNLSASMWWMPSILAAAVVLTSVMKMQDALALRRLHDRYWLLFLGMSVVTLVMAAVILFSENRTFITENESVSVYVPVVLFVDAVFDLIITFRMLKKIKAFKNAADSPAGEEKEEP